MMIGFKAVRIIFRKIWFVYINQEVFLFHYSEHSASETESVQSASLAL